MQNIAALTIAALVLAAMPTGVSAKEQDVPELLDECESSDAFDSGYCLGMVRGTSGIMQANCMGYKRGFVTADDYAADTDGVTFGAMRQAFINWAKANPKQWNASGEMGLVRALRETFPCVE